MATQHDSFGNTDPQRGAQDADAMRSGDKSIVDKLGHLSKSLSNDENGFSNNEGFNTDEGHQPLAGSGGSGTSDMMNLDNQRDIDEDFDNANSSADDFEDDAAFDNEQEFEQGSADSQFDQSTSGGGFGRRDDEIGQNL